jgi:RNA polymerase sigma factor for flagellar operon FliA
VKPAQKADIDIERATYEDNLVRQHLPIVQYVVSEIAQRVPSHVSRSDLVSAGMLGLAQAARSFDPERGIAFDRFASTRIRGAMLDELRGNDYLSRGTRKQQRTIESAVHKLEQKLGRAPVESEIAKEMGVTLVEYQELLGKVRGTQLVYLEDMSGDEGDNDFLDRHVGDDDANPLAQLQDHRMRAALVEAIKVLPEREQYVMSMYYEHDMNLKEIAAVLKVTESRVCQLHSQSIARLRVKLRAY